MIIKGDGILFLFALNIYIIFCTTIRRGKPASRSFLHFLHRSGYHNGRQNCHATSVLLQAPPPGALYIGSDFSEACQQHYKLQKVSHQEVKQVSESLYL